MLELLRRGNFWVMLSLSEKISKTGHAVGRRRAARATPDRARRPTVASGAATGRIRCRRSSRRTKAICSSCSIVSRPTRRRGKRSSSTTRRASSASNTHELLSYRHRGTNRWGAVAGDGVVDLGRRLPDLASLQALLEGGSAALQRAREALAGTAADAALAEIEYRLPIPEPRKIFCIGVNYAHRNAEYKDGSELPKYPSIFMRVPDSFVGHGGALLAAARVDAARLRRRDRHRHRQARAAHRARDGDAPHRRPDLHERGNDPRLGAPRQVQRHARQELRRLGRDRPLDRDRRRIPRRATPTCACRRASTARSARTTRPRT